jgi:hypothetical protein
MAMKSARFTAPAKEVEKIKIAQLDQDSDDRCQQACC